MRYHTLARALTGLWNAAWNGALMASLTYTVGEGNQGGSCQTSVSGRGQTLHLTAKSPDGARLAMVMILPPHKKQGVAPSAVPDHLTPWRTFSAEDIHNASDLVGDHNGIHQGDRPIAGGFLLMEAMAARYAGHKRYKIRFLSPVYAGEALALLEEEQGASAYAGGRLCFQCTWEDS